MALRLIGVDPDSPNNGSPTVWLDEEDDSIVIQGWKIADVALLAQIQATGPIPEHETGTCAECKTSHPHPCPTWTLARQVVSLVHENIRTSPPAGFGHLRR